MPPRIMPFSQGYVYPAIHRHVRQWLSVLLTLSVLSGCASVRQVQYLLKSTSLPLEQLQAPVAATPATTIYAFDSGSNPSHAILFLTGSGCASLVNYLRPYLDGLRGPFRIFALEKPGIQYRDTGLFCSDEFLAENYFAARRDRALAVTDWLLSGGAGLFEKVSLFGVSEGGVIAGEIAALRSGISSVAIIGSGGMSQRQALRILYARGEISMDIDALEKKVSRSPNSFDKSFGQTYRYWSSYFDVSPTEALLLVNAPILAIMGVKDSSEPIESLDYLVQAFENAGKKNLEVKRLEDANHVLSRGGEDLKPVIMDAISGWILKH
ncbi:MAG: prolyl oligopeptidase family serine peptidase [Candidatus Thiodiazotropha sp. (ex Epidulcina cf. delphinae)]|nr:prolyl oligopeptidase family serine peptidase [Candidatus Thiodiazotropha sp. (ex Epidulcina cf. delphinae)]